MTALYIILGIIAFLIILLNIPLNAHLSYYDGEICFKVKYLFFTIFPKKEKPPDKIKKAEKKKDNKEKKKDNTEKQPVKTETEDTGKSETEQKKETAEKEEKAADTKPRKNRKHLADVISDKVDELETKKDAVLDLVDLLWSPLKKMLAKAYISNLVVDFTAADEDAYKAAVLFGKMNAAVYNSVAVMRSYTDVNVRSVCIDCLYNTPADCTKYDGELDIRFRPSSLLNAVFAIIGRFIGNSRKYAPAVKELFF